MSDRVLPSFLKPYQRQGKSWLKAGYVSEVEFSNETYQVLVHDPKLLKSFWTFLQFDERDELKDCFCSLDESHAENEPGSEGCPHLAAAWYRIFGSCDEPLHRRFDRSLWHRLLLYFSDRIGPDPSYLENITPNTYAFFSSGGKQIVYLHAKTEAFAKSLHTMLFERLPATEDTSIKFSNLTPEELNQWRLGHPSAELSYELSFWSDLAKWMFFQQDNNKPYEIKFSSQASQVPNYLEITFEELEAKFSISAALLPQIISTLKTVNINLQVIDHRQDEIEKFIYDKNTATMRVVAKENVHKDKEFSSSEMEHGVDVGEGWKYVPEKGFYASNPHQLLETSVFKGRNIGQLLSNYSSLVQKLLEGAAYHQEGVEASYILKFNSNWSLEIESYIFNPGDLAEQGSQLLGDWVYLNEDGFYHIEGMRFDSPKVIIDPLKVPEFIQHNRLWLNQFPGFQFHLSSIDELLTFAVDASGRLSFKTSEEQRKALGRQRDFGTVVYVEGHGFYPKNWGSGQARPVHAGLSIPKEQVPLFIKMHREDLQLIRGFFTDENPIAQIGVDIRMDRLEKKSVLHIHPHIIWNDSYKHAPLQYYDNFVYIPGKGFSEIPYFLRLPEAYKQETIIQGDDLEHFISVQLEELLPRVVHLDDRLKRPHTIRLETDRLETTDKGAFLTLFRYVSELGSVTAAEVWAAVHQKQRYFPSTAGLLDLTEDRFNWLRSLKKGRFDDKGVLTLTSIELIRLNAFDEIIPQDNNAAFSPRAILESITDFNLTPPPTLKYLKSTLRHYQQLGVHWLWFLYQHSLSGLLCDDMGLGKTHQAMALLDAVHQHNEEAMCLIVCPTSVLFHWQEKLHTFLPEIRVHTFYGNSRSLTHFIHTKGILLTSYGIARNEIEQLAKISFDVVVYDEIQVAKNHLSRVYAALSRIQARHRLGMTGTPIENHLRELKSLFDLTIPHYLPAENDFREFFTKPIEKEGSFPRKNLLSRLIKPFILRRKKEEVLLELPPKIEEIAHCALVQDQRHLYNEVIMQNRPQIISSLENDSSPIPYVHIFSILSALKQICNHPAAYLKKPEKYKDYASGKWDLFTELLSEARQSGQKVVVFSQYLAMLDIMCSYLEEHEVGYSLLIGSTRDRGEVVKRFQTDPTCEVFLGSLQAAGTGIDLTAASVVIHYDRWWNAAKEDQATDRVHRMGQSQGVQVFKLVTKETFEERIDRMIREKAKLMEEVVTVDDHQIIKQFNRHELLDLLKTVDAGKGIATVKNVDDL